MNNGKRKGIESPETLKSRAELLRAMAARMDLLSSAAAKMELTVIDIDGATRFDRGTDLINDFLKACHGEIAREEFSRGIV